jgi:hypothetical protein
VRIDTGDLDVQGNGVVKPSAPDESPYRKLRITGGYLSIALFAVTGLAQIAGRIWIDPDWSVGDNWLWAISGVMLVTIGAASAEFLPGLLGRSK